MFAEVRQSRVAPLARKATVYGAGAVILCTAAVWNSRAARAAGGGDGLATPPCAGDCNGDLRVTIDELLIGVAISLGRLPLSVCFVFDHDDNGAATIDELAAAVRSLLSECGRRPTSTPTPILTDTPTITSGPSVTRTPSTTPTVTRTGTPTNTATPSSASVCGGAITSVPKLCDVEVVPNPVPLFGAYDVRFCLSDLEGDLQQRCLAIRTAPAPTPVPNCVPVQAAGQRINGCFRLGEQRSTQPAGQYAVVLHFEDRQGNRSNTVEAPFNVQ
jgi:hypothetical protein